MEKITIQKINEALKTTIHKRKIVELPKGKEIKPKDTKATIQIGNLVQVETNLGAFVCSAADFWGLLQLFKKVKQVTAWKLYSYYRSQPKSWADALWLLKKDIAGIQTHEALDVLEDEIAETDMFNDKALEKAVTKAIKTQRIKLTAAEE